MMTFDEHLRQMELDDGCTQEVNRSLALAFFFLVNLMLAVIGTVIPAAKIVRTKITKLEKLIEITKFYHIKVVAISDFMYKSLI